MDDKVTRENQQPATGSDSYKALRLERDFVKHGESYSSRLFRSLEDDVQKYLLVETTLEQDELPVFAIFEDRDTWLLATSRKISWSRPGFKHQLAYEQIAKIGQSEMDSLQESQESNENYEKMVMRIRKIRTSSPWLYFGDVQGNRHEALLPPGAVLFAVWNSIQFMVKLERIHSTKAGR